MTRTSPNTEINLQQINARNDQARHIVADCASAMPTLAALWRPVDDALSDAVLLSALVARLSAQVARLSAQVARLSAERDQVRLDRANLRAAMRAALAAHADGEPDPMWYLRDELNARQARPAGSRGPA